MIADISNSSVNAFANIISYYYVIIILNKPKLSFYICIWHDKLIKINIYTKTPMFKIKHDTKTLYTVLVFNCRLVSILCTEINTYIRNIYIYERQKSAMTKRVKWQQCNTLTPPWEEVGEICYQSGNENVQRFTNSGSIMWNTFGKHKDHTVEVKYFVEDIGVSTH